MSVTLSPKRDALLAIARSLPAAPQVLLGVCELLQDINTDLDQIAATIRMDTGLAARVIRVSNSVVYGGGGGIASVDEAVGRVGFSEVVRLVGVAVTARIVERELRAYHVSVDLLREALLMHALASEALAESTGLDRQTAYAAGLLRGVGMMVLDRYATDQRLGPENFFDPTAFDTYDRWEAARFGMPMTAVTTMALDDWRFPEEVVGAIEAHLVPPDSGDDIGRLATVINLAGAIATEQGLALPGEVLHWTVTPEKLSAAGIDESQFASASEQARRVFEQQRAALY